MTEDPPRWNMGLPPKEGAKVLPFRRPGARPELNDDGEFEDVLDTLYAAIEMLESIPEKDRPTGIFVGMYKNEPHVESFPYYNFGLTRIELLGLLTQYARSVL